MDTSNSFTYSISSADGTDSLDQLCNDTYIDLGPIVSPNTKYYVICTGFAITPTSLQDDGTTSVPDYIHLVCDELTENGYNTGLINNQIILGTLQTSIHIGAMLSGEGAHFQVKNMGAVRKIRFRLYNPDLTPLSVNHIDTDCYWCAQLLFTPLD
jgi:hypothetical protein